MHLHYREYGSPQHPQVLILHGLFGASDNWASQAKLLAADFHVLALDARNHGQSPRAPSMGYPDMAADVIRLMDRFHLEQAALVGHSMGGKTAMLTALTHGDRIRRLAVVDIAPKRYPRHHDDVLAALADLDLASLKSRGAAESLLARSIHDRSVAAFLVKNLYRHGQGFAWRIDLPAIRANYDRLMDPADAGTPYPGPTLFIKGGNSDYIGSADRDRILSLFPNAGVKVVQNAGHWPHADKAAVFAKILGDFLRRDLPPGQAQTD